MKTWEEMTERERYEMLCRGEVSTPTEVEKNLKCRYVDRGIAFLKIAPFKEEEAYLDPRIVVYHNVIYDEEIETIKRMAQPRVKKLLWLFFSAGDKVCFRNFLEGLKSFPSPLPCYSLNARRCRTTRPARWR